LREVIARDRNLVALATAGAVFLVFLLVYYLPRTAQLRRERESLQQLSSTRQEVALLLPQVVQSAFTTPEPADNVRSWIAAEALPGLEKQLVANDGYLEGKGAQVKLHRMSPQQASQFLSQLTKVRLVVERMLLQDSDRDGRWDMEIDLRVPSSMK
jgi:type II secretory pathway component PulM